MHWPKRWWIELRFATTCQSSESSPHHWSHHNHQSWHKCWPVYPSHPQRQKGCWGVYQRRLGWWNREVWKEGKSILDSCRWDRGSTSGGQGEILATNMKAHFSKFVANAKLDRHLIGTHSWVCEVWLESGEERVVEEGEKYIVWGNRVITFQWESLEACRTPQCPKVSEPICVFCRDQWIHLFCPLRDGWRYDFPQNCLPSPASYQGLFERKEWRWTLMNRNFPLPMTKAKST